MNIHIPSIPRHLRMITIVGILLTVEVIVVLLFIAPSIEEISALQGAVDARMRDLETRYARGAQFNKLKTTYEKYAPILSTWEQRFIKESDVLNLITELETLAGRASVTKTIAFGQSSPTVRAPEGTKPFPLDLSIDGPFPNVLQYLRSIERLPLFYTIEQWSFIEKTPLTDIGFTNQQKGHVLVRLTGTLWQKK
ncbi:MAG: hypothetical protein HZB10_00080 [Candidatus Yonathbacteria bacterium]|nr:hypothetical protein [Candidatus Yonathbacteria bacterium]